ncbi:conjugative transposon protein TraN [Dyadobacter chenhuakuii]|uniref:Conjugative transposon protein TraN n=1 Tax=Dyadobacter chenhuakuii TaxID=2909339 RepID=A0A9X1TSC4_9BACT|nr:conjugative transposon protein TraN [Dyadobacter chenhuakuii]MCF2496777.1 conjugative transposon protein TraN [Dyadobacter chenhuakuii]
MRIFLLCQLLLCLFLHSTGICQGIESSVIAPFPLEVTTGKTTHLIFPFSIKTVDRGSPDVLAQKATGAENILQLKAAKPDFDTTNLTVITADGKLFSFLVGYADEPHSLNIQLTTSASQIVQMGSTEMNEARISDAAKEVDAGQAGNVSLKDKTSQTELSLSALYVDEDLLLYKIDLANNSAIKYDIENLRFFVRDKNHPKRTAIQETEIKPLHILGDTNAVAPRSSHSFVYVLPKMTIPDKKYLAVQVQEKNGGRHLTLKVRNRHVLKALTLNH